MDKRFFPTPMIGMVGLHEDVKMITTISFKNAGDVIYVLGETAADFNGSELQKRWSLAMFLVVYVALT